MTALTEKYCPARWSGVVGQDDVIRTIDRLRPRGLAGRTYWITGASGTGKTSIARLLAAEVADEWAISEYSTPRKLDAAELKRIGDSYRYRVLGRGTCCIVNEAHLLRKDQIGELLGLTEDAPDWVTWIFTTTNEGMELFAEKMDSSPFSSRTMPLALTSCGLAREFAVHCKQIAILEGLDRLPLDDYVALAGSCDCNLRAMFQKVEAGRMMGGS